MPEFYRRGVPGGTFRPDESLVFPHLPTATPPGPMIESRFDVVTGDQLEALAARPLPNAPNAAVVSVLYRDLYLDTTDEQLERRGITCRLRVGSDDSRVLTVFVGVPDDPAPPRRYDAKVDSADPRIVVGGNSQPARRLAAVVDVRLLEVRLELQVDRVVRVAEYDMLRRPRVQVYYDRIDVRSAASSRAFHQVTVTADTKRPAFDAICAELEGKAGLRPIAAGTRERAQLLLKWMTREERGRAAQYEAGVALILTRGDRVALSSDGEILFLPFERGSGVGVARTLLDRWTSGTGNDVRLLGKMSAIGPLPAIEVWTAEVPPSAIMTESAGQALWLTRAEALQRAANLDANGLAAVAVAIRAGLLAPGTTLDHPAPRQTMSTAAFTPQAEAGSSEPYIINSETSILAFTARVLELAEDVRNPLGERLRFLSIVAANLDEFFMVRVAGIKRSAAEQTEERGSDGLTAEQQLELIALHARSLIARQYRCYEACAAEAIGHGARMAQWTELDTHQRAELRAAVKEMMPSLTPMAMTLSPGHPFPRLRHLCLSLAVVFVDRPGSTPHFAQVEIPEDTTRFIPVPGMNAVIAIEELIRANIDLLYPSSVVEQTYTFRVTRGTDLDLHEDRSASLIQEVERATRQRFDQPVVRVEVEQAMPAVLRDVVMRELRREQGGGNLDMRDLYEVDGPLDLTCLDELPLSDDPKLWFPPFRGANPLPADRTLWETIDEGDRLCHHPFDDYDATVVRFFREAAADPAVTAIKLTIYRADDDSPIMGALVDAAAAGKDVIVFVELKARFDEERNVGWAKRMEAAGGRVVHGLVGVKTHAKVALVVRRNGHGHRRYVHAGTGNYNAQTAKRYTDLSLLTANDRVVCDVQDLFNELTGRSRPPERLNNGCLISPRQLLPELVSRIEREAAHARAGRGGRIRMKLNGLSDPDIVNALVRASNDGVRVELVVRGVCTLRPGVPGVTENISIVCAMGRFLEHSRIIHFANAGTPEYFIGSADMRPRNLRRRVELMVPVTDRDNRAELDELIETYLRDPTAWVLGPDGEYVRRRAEGSAAQEQLAAARTQAAGRESRVTA
ncbi:MAG TPA: polyphosphate kinase 1 [Gemmatimonadaceae bacterium]|nr:polyphosphate kinase 1 [Gemmatimonadaceae bacterium]